MKNTGKSHKFLILDGSPPKAPQLRDGATRVYLHIFRSMSAQGFSYPFTGMSRVREALRIHFKPLLGDAAAQVSIIPFLLGKDKKTSTGCAFLLFGDETRAFEGDLGAADKYAVWPTPLAFADTIAGNGLLVWRDEQWIATLWLDDWVPRFYKATPRADSDEETEEGAALAYIAGQGGAIDRLARLHAEDYTEEDIQAHGMKTLSLCPAYEHLDLSNKGTNLLEQRERIVGRLTKIGRIAVAAGVVFLACAAGIAARQASLVRRAPDGTGAIYANAFGERSRQPVGSSREKVRSLAAPEEDASVFSILRAVTGVWDNLGVSDDITIETLKYGTENTDILGTTRDNESIQRLRQLFEEAGFVPKTDNIQTIPGGALRFNLTLSRGNK